MHVYEKTEKGIEPRHYVEMTTKEGLRPTRITDFRKWRKEGKPVAPSVTTILDVFAKPALTNWLIDQYVNTAYELDPANYQEAGLWNDAVRYKADMEKDKAPQAGTDFHELMETFTAGAFTGTPEEAELCSSVVDVIETNTMLPIQYWQAEVNVFSDKGYAGQCDLFIKGERGRPDWVIDYKTKQFEHQFKKKLAYPDSHCSQLAAYGNELSDNYRAANVFVCLETGAVKWHEWTQDELVKWFEYFMLALKAWEIKNG